MNVRDQKTYSGLVQSSESMMSRWRFAIANTSSVAHPAASTPMNAATDTLRPAASRPTDIHWLTRAVNHW